MKYWLRRYLFARCVKRWVSYGVTSTEYLCDLGIERERILQIQNCVDEELFRSPLNRQFPLSNRPTVLFVGQLIERKGIYQFLNAAEALRNEGLDFSIVIVGDGPESQRVDETIERLGIDRLTRIPYISPEEMGSIYRSSDCLVFPTLEDVWGLVVNEALLSGLPVLSSCYAGCSLEIVPDDNIFDPLDVEEFKRVLRRAVVEGLAPADPRPLLPLSEVVQLIMDDINANLARS